MGKKIFVSYKYSDIYVQNFNNNLDTRARHYVDKLDDLLEEEDHIYKGEDDDEECGLSEGLAYQIQAEGFSKIYIFSGGWNQWLMAKLPVEK